MKKLDQSNHRIGFRSPMTNSYIAFMDRKGVTASKRADTERIAADKRPLRCKVESTTAAISFAHDYLAEANASARAAIDRAKRVAMAVRASDDAWLKHTGIKDASREMVFQLQYAKNLLSWVPFAERALKQKNWAMLRRYGMLDTVHFKSLLAS